VNQSRFVVPIWVFLYKTNWRRMFTSRDAPVFTGGRNSFLHLTSGTSSLTSASTKHRRELGFNYDWLRPRAGRAILTSTDIAGRGSIVGPRNSTQNDYELYDSVSLMQRAHTIKINADARNTRITAFQTIAPNAFLSS
jgi:hypothetical protein